MGEYWEPWNWKKRELKVCSNVPRTWTFSLVFLTFQGNYPPLALTDTFKAFQLTIRRMLSSYHKLHPAWIVLVLGRYLGQQEAAFCEPKLWLCPGYLFSFQRENMCAIAIGIAPDARNFSSLLLCTSTRLCREMGIVLLNHCKKLPQEKSSKNCCNAQKSPPHPMMSLKGLKKRGEMHLGPKKLFWAKKDFAEKLPQRTEQRCLEQRRGMD